MINDQVLLLNQTYALHNQENVSGRLITRYLLAKNTSETVIAAAEAVNRLLMAHPNLIPIFDLANLSEKIGNHKYLIINHQAVCISDEPYGEVDIRDTDRYFTQKLLNEPVRCSNEKHVFEKASAEFWRAKSSHCPVGNDHLLGDLAIDDELKEEVRVKRTRKEKQLKETEDILKGHQKLQIEYQMLQNKLELQRLHNLITTAEQNQAIARGQQQIIALAQKKMNPLGSFVKIGVKLCPLALKELAKFAPNLIIKFFPKLAPVVGKTVALGGTKLAGKVVPGICLLMGIGLAIYRSTKGEYKRAVGEVASGVVACIPFVGIFLSISIDLTLLGCDIHVANRTSSVEVNNRNSQLVVTVNPYELLGLTDNPPPTKEVVDKAYRDQVLLVHPDSIARDYQEAEDPAEMSQQLTRLLNQAKDNIYVLRGWQDGL